MARHPLDQMRGKQSWSWGPTFWIAVYFLLAEGSCMSLSLIKVEHDENLLGKWATILNVPPPTPRLVHAQEVCEISVLKIFKNLPFLKERITIFYYHSKDQTWIRSFIGYIFSVKSGCSFCEADALCWENRGWSSGHLLSVTGWCLVSHDWLMQSSNAVKGVLLKNFRG